MSSPLKPAMAASGVFFMPKSREAYIDHTNGQWRLTLKAYQRNPCGQLECYSLLWKGAEAEDWYKHNAAQLVGGTPVQAHWYRQNTFIDGNRVRIVARCSSIAIAARGGVEHLAETEDALCK